MAGGSAPGGRHDGRFRDWAEGPGGDRRVARGSRTRALMLDSMIDLIDAGDPTPTAREVAERAGVAVRTLYHHFGCLDRLFTGAADRQVSHYRYLVTSVPPHGPLEVRIRALARQRRLLFEAIGPVLQASSARTPASTALTDVLDGQRSLLRQQLARTLEPELATLRPGPAMLLEALTTVSGWQHWAALRGESGHSAAQAEQAVVFTLLRILGSPVATAVGSVTVSPAPTRGSD